MLNKLIVSRKFSLIFFLSEKYLLNLYVFKEIPYNNKATSLALKVLSFKIKLASFIFLLFNIVVIVLPNLPRLKSLKELFLLIPNIIILSDFEPLGNIKSNSLFYF